MTTTAIVLAGHGSHISPLTAGLVWKHVDRLRAMGIADEITAAFWKEMPSFSTVINSLTATDITVVPLFTAQGYFSQTVIPAEMRLDGAITHRDNRLIRYTCTLSEHPYLGEIVRNRIEETLRTSGAAPDQTAVAVIGHSTKRNPESRKATEAQADRLRESGIVSEVVAVYLDDTPEIAEVYTLTSASTLIAVPYFLALGSHTTIDVPDALGLEPGQAGGSINGRNVIYTQPVGIEESLLEVIIELVKEAGMPLHPTQEGSVWDCFPGGKLDLRPFFPTEREFGQLRITANSVYPLTNSPDIEPQCITDPGTLRDFVREKNGFRPLSTSTDLPGGWIVPVESLSKACAVIETVYPGLLADFLVGRARQNTFDATIQRQTGMYRQLLDMSKDEQQEMINEVCAFCVRSPTWFADDDTKYPCPEPCNFWLSRALEKIDK